MVAPQIRRLSLKKFRGFESLTWFPAPGMNLILGGGDVGKSTILEAIALLLHPTNGYTLSDSDYWKRRVEDEFCIEAVMYLPDSTGIHKQNATAWPWEWNGTDAVLPMAEGGGELLEHVHKVRVRGTADLEIVYEFEQPDGTAIGFSTSLRRNIGVVRLAGDDRNDRDLRLIQGGGLDRLLADKGLKAKLGHKVAQFSIEDAMSDDAQAKLATLGTTFGKTALPTNLGLGFIGGAGLSIGSLVGLTAERDNILLPLTSWGSGTRRLSSLVIADSLQDGRPITVVDELERGLESYRQRRLVQSLLTKETQSFVTTHSATVISAAAGTALWYVDAQGAIGSLPATKVAKHQAKDPEAFLARLSIVAEGITEVGFIMMLLTRFIAKDWEGEGIRVTDAGGNESVLNLLEALTSGGLRFAGFADCEPESLSPGRWGAVQSRLGDLLLRWEHGCLEENILPLFRYEDLKRVIEDHEGERTGMRLRTLADRLDIKDSTFEAVSDAAAACGGLMPFIVQAAIGYVPVSMINDKAKAKSFKAHARLWFKSLEGGKELADKMFEFGVWPNVSSKLLPFLNAIRITMDMPSLPEDQT